MEAEALDEILKLRKICMNNNFSSKIFHEYIRLLGLLGKDWYDIQYSLLLETNFIEMFAPENIYSEYYVEKKALMEKLALFYWGKPIGTFVSKRKKRIAFCTNTWRDQRYSIGIAIATLANEFVKQGYEVSIFIENQYIHSGLLKNILCPELLISAEKYKKQHRQMLLPEVEVNYNSGHTMAQRVQNYIAAVFAYEPVCILDITDENSCCSRVLYESIPSIYFPMRSGHGSSAFFHKHLTNDSKRMKQILKKYSCFSEELLVEIVTGITEYPKPFKKYCKQEIIRRKDAFVLVTVGNRLKTDMDKDWIDTLLAILKKNSDFVWIIVGKEVPEYIHRILQCKLLKNQIILWGFEEDLAGLFQICDVYVNPKRKGGGLSIAWAMNEGLPIATYRYPSDAMSWTGEENTIPDTEDSLQWYIEKLAKDKIFYDIESKKMKIRTEEKNPEKCVQQIIKLIEEIGDVR